MRPPVTDKRDMYTRLMRGEFGNHTPQWTDVEAWAFDSLSPPHRDVPLWGLRHMGVAKAARLNVFTADVPRVLHREFRGGYSISPMVDQWTTLRAYLYQTTAGPCLWHVVGYNTIPWHYAFREFGDHLEGARVWPFLAGFLRDNDMDMVRELYNEYPDHVTEFTNCNRTVGVMPNHRVVVWEVRSTNGKYEGW